MPTRRFLRLLLASLTLLSASAGGARAEVEVGAFLGAHLFSADNQLGRYLNGPADLAPQHMGLVGLRASWQPWAHLAAEGEFAFIPTYTRGGGQPFTPVLSYRGNLRIDLLAGRIRPFLLVGGGALTLLSTNSAVVHGSTQEHFDIGLGGLFDVGKGFGLRVDGRMLVVPSVDRTEKVAGGVHHQLWAEDWEVLVGFYYRFGAGRLSPTEGVEPPLCTPVAAAPAAGSAADPDRDGITSDVDACPDQAGPPENRGCPDTDRDSDGVVDRLDRCPDVRGSKDAAGCPEADRDFDETPDAIDACPDLPGPRENKGCPDGGDRDGDGIPDATDQCPDQPEKKNGYKDQDGCPDEIPADLRRFTGVVKEIQFEANSATLLPSSLPPLDEAAAVLKEHPELRVEIGGHTDASGPVTTNMRLSQSRAEAVREHLIKKGVPATRLKAVGYGPLVPVDDNKTAIGRAANRRVEFRLLQ